MIFLKNSRESVNFAITRQYGGLSPADTPQRVRGVRKVRATQSIIFPNGKLLARAETM